MDLHSNSAACDELRTGTHHGIPQDGHRADGLSNLGATVLSVVVLTPARVVYLGQLSATVI